MRHSPVHRAAWRPDAGGAPADRQALPETACDSYAPGHLMHYTHQGRALRSPGVAAEEVTVADGEVTVVLPGGDLLRWRHHDLPRLTRLLDLVLGPRVVYRELHALRVGPYWFNCADELHGWSDCR